MYVYTHTHTHTHTHPPHRMEVAMGRLGEWGNAGQRILSFSDKINKLQGSRYSMVTIVNNTVLCS